MSYFLQNGSPHFLARITHQLSPLWLDQSYLSPEVRVLCRLGYCREKLGEYLHFLPELLARPQPWTRQPQFVVQAARLGLLQASAQARPIAQHQQPPCRFSPISYRTPMINPYISVTLDRVSILLMVFVEIGEN